MKKLMILSFLCFGLPALACDMYKPEILKFVGLEELSELVCTDAVGPVYYKNGKLAGTRGGQWFHPNGRLAGQKGGQWFHPNGMIAGSQMSVWYHSSGRMAGSEGGPWYNKNGRTMGVQF